MFRVTIRNENKEQPNVVNNVTEIELCKDGRHLVHYDDSPEPLVWQAPKGYMVISEWVPD